MSDKPRDAYRLFRTFGSRNCKAEVLSTLTHLALVYSIIAGVNLRPWNKHLATQLGWFKSHLESTCGSNCTQTLKNSLLVLGEFGGVDYYNCFFQNKQVPEVRTYVPIVIAEIIRGIREVIQMGATRIL
ncbi:hypothetical protein RND71_034423 [Anisodus tanguticus]|uniref:Uncharacterized protein n=1 Tax=Anisodus tanguticus TaxID=243964 RepID=A0AAE1V473_9SOLA|nr:hypothetical protein RND71_034423 [Anisodus tanguticus]